MKIIPFSPKISSIQNFNVNLGELVCNFHILWNARAGSWFCDIETTTGKNCGMRLVENTPLLGATNRTGLKGDFRILKFNKLCSEPITYENFGSDWKLVFGTDKEWSLINGI